MNAHPSITYGLISVTGADFADRTGPVFGCQNSSPAPNPISAITTAVGAPPIVVIGTKGDPATVYANSAKMAAARGINSVELTWEGAGHTAFTESRCIADAATASKQGDTKQVAVCVGAKLANTNNQGLVVHELLGANIPDLVKLRATIQEQCK